MSFGGTPATSFTVDSATGITAVLGAGASGSVSVTTPDGTASLAGFTFTLPPPVSTITSFTPTSGAAGATIIIKGTNLTGATSVSFGGTPATSFTVDSATGITSVLGTGASGSVSVTTPDGTASLAGFTFTLPPPVSTITSFTPTSGAAGATIIIKGTNLTGTTSVSFGGTPATSFTVDSATGITAVLGAGASGSVSVTTPDGTASLAGFTFTLPPPVSTITSFTPTSGAAGATIIIKGTNLTGTTSVSFGGTPATSFTVDSATGITAVLGAGANGSVSVTTLDGTASLAGFTFIQTPTITFFTPTSAQTGSTVTITGSNFTGATAVSFGGTSATSFIVVSPTTIQAVVGDGATGNITISSPNGTATLLGFAYLPPFALLQFTGALVSNQAHLQWQTQNEQSIADYVIERSPDSVTFTSIGIQQAQHTGSGVNNYAFNDPNLLAGDNYYQIKTIDTSGNAVSSMIVDVKLPGSNNAVTLYPNPAKGVVNITVPSSANQATLQIVDLHGNVFGTVTVDPNTSQVKVDFTGASGGFYILSWTDGIRKYVKKIMVID
jgi:hypothetical protein